MKLNCDTTRAYMETKLVYPEYYSCNIPALDGTTETSSEIILTEGYSFPKGRNAIQIIYRTGYKPEEMPENLKRATLCKYPHRSLKPPSEPLIHKKPTDIQYTIGLCKLHKKLHDLT